MSQNHLARTKDELVSIVSHELRTPLASVVGFAELLLARPVLAEEQRQQFLGVMVEEGRRLTALINDFLDMQRLESGRQSIVLRPSALRQIVEQAVFVAGVDPERPIVLDLAADLPLVRADAHRLRQVLGNLLGNARKYSPYGGLSPLEAGVADGHVVVAVEDHGLGLPGVCCIASCFRRTVRGASGCSLARLRPRFGPVVGAGRGCGCTSCCSMRYRSVCSM
jgi:signal transduction histidine kinase